MNKYYWKCLSLEDKILLTLYIVNRPITITRLKIMLFLIDKILYQHYPR